MSYWLAVLSFFICLNTVFAADEKAVSPSPSPSASPFITGTDSLTYASKMKAREERRKFNELVKEYEEMKRKKAEAEKAAEAAKTPVVKETEKTLRAKRAASEKEAEKQKRVLVS